MELKNKEGCDMYIALSIIGYLVFGFFYGIIREYAGAPLVNRKEPRSAFQKYLAVFLFPVTSFDPDGADMCRARPALLKKTRGGFLYWNTVMFLWPATIVWSVFVLLCIPILILVALTPSALALPGKLCQRCEMKVKSMIGSSLQAS